MDGRSMTSSIICVDSSDYNGICSFTICISNDNNVYSFGYSDLYSHGHKDKTIYPPKQISSLSNIIMIDCGINYTICLDNNGDVYSFGDNEGGFLGISNEIKQTHIPQKINIPPCKQVSCGDKFTICLTKDNTLYCFGYNSYGELGLPTEEIWQVTHPQQIPSLTNVEFIVCSSQHAICKTYDNIYYSWGYNIDGRLGLGHYDEVNGPTQCNFWPDNIKSIKCGYNYSLLLTIKGEIYSFGDNSCGQLGFHPDDIYVIDTPTLIEDIPEIQRIECGYTHTLCIDIEYNLWVFGYNDCCKLGLGDSEKIYYPRKHTTLTKIIDISAKGDHSFVKTSENKIYAFGYNEYSQIGINKITENQAIPIQVLKGKEDIWKSKIQNSRVKSARK